MCNGTPYFVILDLFSVISCLSYICVLLIYVSISIHLTFTSLILCPYNISLPFSSFPCLLFHHFCCTSSLSSYMSYFPVFCLSPLILPSVSICLLPLLLLQEFRQKVMLGTPFVVIWLVGFIADLDIDSWLIKGLMYAGVWVAVQFLSKYVSTQIKHTLWHTHTAHAVWTLCCTLTLISSLIFLLFLSKHTSEFCSFSDMLAWSDLALITFPCFISNMFQIQVCITALLSL